MTRNSFSPAPSSDRDPEVPVWQVQPEQTGAICRLQCGSAEVSLGTKSAEGPAIRRLPCVPPNWESAAQIAKNKPPNQTVARLFQAATWGGVSDDPSETDFSTVFPYPTAQPTLDTPIGVLNAPYSYWQR